jgi:hypothetical protein
VTATCSQCDAPATGRLYMRAEQPDGVREEDMPRCPLHAGMGLGPPEARDAGGALNVSAEWGAMRKALEACVAALDGGDETQRALAFTAARIALNLEAACHRR